MNLLYERDLQPMKLEVLKGTRQDAAVTALAGRLGISRQRMRRILIRHCDMLTLENLGPRTEAADAAGDPIQNALSLPHLTTATGILAESSARKYYEAAKDGAAIDALLQEILEEIS
jgi:energy-converting hydrogenase A subunit M